MGGKGRTTQKSVGPITRLDLRNHSTGGATALPSSTLPPISVERTPLGASALARSSRGNTGLRTADARRRIAVALHDVEPATFERCALLRGWLADRGVDRVTLLVIPARDLHPLGERSPEMIEWLTARRRAGDSIAQHGFQHEQLRQGGWAQQALLPMRSRRAAEFVGLDGAETRRAVEAGWRVLKLAGIEPDGFVAPAYAYTKALRATLACDGALGSRFRWWAGLLGLHSTRGAGAGRSRMLAPAWGIGSGRRARLLCTPALFQAGALLGDGTLRLDLHPGDLLEHPRQMTALERMLDRARVHARAITYDELAASI
jgi:predicted deacetylase